MRILLPSFMLLLTLILVLAGCGPRDAEGGVNWAGTVDTLPGGRVVVTNPAQGIWSESTQWVIEETLRIGTFEGEGADLFGQITDIRIDPAGRIWVLEGQSQEIRVFDAGGRHVRTIGRKGGGPGEFRQAAAMDWAPDGTLWVMDPRNNRVSVIDTAGTFVRSFRTAGGFIIFPWPGGFDAAGRYYSVVPVQSDEGFRTAMVQFDTAMTPLDTIERPRYEGPAEFFEMSNDRGRMRAGVPYQPGLRTMLHPDGTFWALHTGDYRLFEITLAGDTLRTISRAFDPIPVTDADIDAAVANLEWFTSQGGKIDRSKFPSTKTPVTNFTVDDEGNVWVARRTDAGPGVLVDVFDVRGRYLGELTLPFSTGWGRVPRIRDRSFYTVTRDELDVPYVVRGRIVRPEET